MKDLDMIVRKYLTYPRLFKYSSRGRTLFSEDRGCEDVRNTPLIFRRNEFPLCEEKMQNVK